MVNISTQMRIQDAIFEVSELQKDINRLRSGLYGDYYGPIAVNEKNLDTGYLKTTFDEQITEIAEKITRLTTLKAKIQQANLEARVGELSVTEALIRVKELRSILQLLEAGYQGTRTKIENVGAVRYGMFDDEYYLSIMEGYRKEVTSLSQAIDLANSTTFISI